MFLKLKNHLTSVVLCSILSIGFAVSSEAAEEVPDFELDTMVVTAATSTPTNYFKTPASISVITKEEIERKHYKTLNEILDDVPGINTVTYAEGQGFEVSGESNIRIRGSASVVVVVDGVVQKIGNGYAGMNQCTQNMDDIERVEVLRGSASTIYGADAVGGVINIVTKKAVGTPINRVSIAAGDDGRRNMHFNSRGGVGKMFYSVSYDKNKKGNFKNGAGEETKRKYDSDALELKVGYNLSDVTDYTFKYNLNQLNSYGKYINPGKKGYVRTWGGDYSFHTMTNAINYKSKDGKEANTFAVMVGHRTYDRFRNASSDPTLKSWEARNTNNISITDRYYKELSDNNRLSAGFEYQRYSVQTPSTPPHTRMRVNSIYIQDEWDAMKNLRLNGGVRYVDAKAHKNDFLYTAGASYEVNDKVNLYASYAEYFKTPGVAAMFGNLTGYKPNPDIKPETGKTFDIGTKIRVNENTHLEVGVFDRIAENAIVAFSNLGLYKNVSGKTHVKGIEATFDTKIGKNWLGKLGYSRVYSDDNTTILYIPQNSFSANLTYKQPNYDITLQGIYKGHFIPSTSWMTSHADKDYLPNYFVWNLSANYKVKNNVKLFANIYNLFDKNYMTYTTWNSLDPDDYMVHYYASGRSFMVGAEVTF